MNKAIHIYYINRIKDCDRRIFEAADDDYINYRIVSASERAIDHWLDKARIIDKDERNEIVNHCHWHNDNCAEMLEKLGWTIIRGKENL